MRHILTLLCVLISAQSLAAVHYVGGGSGQNFGTNCDRINGPSSPDAYMNSRNHCYLPGDTLYWTSGTFVHNSPHFRSGFIDLRGAPGKPIIIAPRPGEYDAVTNPCPVTFSGQFIFEQEDWGAEQRWGSRDVHIAPGVCFINTTTTGDVITVESSGIHIENSRVQADPGDYSQSTASGKDGVKITNPTDVVGAYPVSDVYVKNLEILDCSEDGIDITGPSNVTVHGTSITNVAINQMKLGLRFASWKWNTHSNSATGVGARGGECPINDFCGSPHLETAPIDERFSAQYVAIKHVTMDTIPLANAVNISGMGDVVVSDVTVTNGNTVSGSIVVWAGNSTLAYVDPISVAYCAANPSECSSCLMANPDCNLIPHKSARARIVNSSFSGNGPMLLVQSDPGVNGLSDLCWKNNTWISSPDPAVYSVLGTGYSDISLTGIPEC